MGCSSSKAAAPVVSHRPPDHSSPSPRKSATSEEVKRPFAMTYELREKLGKGQYATVHKVIHKRDRTVCAAKCIRKDALTKEDMEALSVEVKAMELLTDHPNFVRYYDFFNEKDYFFVVMELITGGELFDRICTKERYTEREARALMLQLASGVAFAHSRGIVHRDLKPENILLKSRDDDTSIKLADLGFAKILSGANQLMTTPCGTPGYVAPEVISNKPYTAACDVWSLGVIFYILLCGYPPFMDDDQNKLFSLIRAGNYKFDPAEWGAISDGAKDLIRRILVVDPARRITAAQILQHPWMQMDAAAIPDVQLGSSLEQMKRFVARRRLKAAINTVRSTVRVKMLLAAKAARAAKAAGASDTEAQRAFFRAASAVKLRPQGGSAAGSNLPAAAIGVGAVRRGRSAAGASSAAVSSAGSTGGAGNANHFKVSQLRGVAQA